MIKKVVKLILVISFLSFLFTSCTNDNDEVVEKLDIIQSATKISDLSLLMEAIKKADLVTNLKLKGPFTIFAPKNEAFQALLDSNEKWISLTDIDKPTLQSVLKYHVISGKIKASELKHNQVLTTLSSDKVTIFLKDEVSIKTVNGQNVKIVKTDVEASNGIIHFVDQVLLPSSK